MSKRINLSGKKFGKLTVLNLYHIMVSNKGKRKTYQTFWRCLCTCGRESIVRTYSLTMGHTKSCGCLKLKGRIGESRLELAPSLSPTIKDICWAAGIYEGEGHCEKHGIISIPQKDPWILYKLQSLFGGRVSKPPTQIARWRLCGPRARGFLMTIYSILSPRRQEQAKRAF
jgi:hypothetical protein